MDRKFNFGFIVLLLLSFCQLNLYGQNERTIYLMRAKQFYGSGAKMNLMINDTLFHKIKNGNRLIIRTNSQDTLKIQIVYPLAKKHKSEIIQITPDNEQEVYIDLFYWGEAYNPQKHAGAIRGPHGGTPDFNIEIIKMTKEAGEQKFNQSDKFKDNKKILEKRFP